MLSPPRGNCFGFYLFRKTPRTDISEIWKGHKIQVIRVTSVWSPAFCHHLSMGGCSWCFPKGAPTKMARWRHSVPGLSGMLQRPSSKQGSFAVSRPPIGQTEPLCCTFGQWCGLYQKKTTTTWNCLLETSTLAGYRSWQMPHKIMKTSDTMWVQKHFLLLFVNKKYPETYILPRTL